MDAILRFVIDQCRISINSRGGETRHGHRASSKQFEELASQATGWNKSILLMYGYNFYTIHSETKLTLDWIWLYLCTLC
jgi:hypothetical protein